MHINNRVEDEERPQTIRKPVTPELDIEDLKAMANEPVAKSPDFAGPIALAAASGAAALRDEQATAKVRAAHALAKQEFKAIAANIKEKYGVAIGYAEPWAYNPKPKAAYGLWKRVITMFLDQPESLALGPTAMAARLNKSDIGYAVTRDMFYDKLNPLAQKDLVRLLKTFGVSLQLKQPVSISSVRNALRKQREESAGVPIEEFTGRFAIRGNRFTVNGAEYEIQLGKSGKPRIKHCGSWLPLEVLKAVCSAK